MITKYITKYSSNCKVCMYLEYQRLFFSNVGQHFNLRPNFEL